MNEINSKKNEDLLNDKKQQQQQIDVNTQATNSTLNNKENEMGEQEKMTKMYLLTPNQIKTNNVLSLKEILRLFNCAISQEQAWAVLYQTLNRLKYLFKHNLDLVKINLDNIDINSLYFNKDGNVLFGFKNVSNDINNYSTDSNWISSIEQERSLIETKALKAVAYLIFDALDYGNNYHNEPVLQTTLSHLLLLISGHFKEFSNNKAVSEDDEGYEQEEEESISLEKALETCSNNINEAEKHYQAVCRGLFAQAYELKAFLAKIEDSKNILQNSGKDTDTHYCFEVLDSTDWANLWMQVIHELRNGVKLRKVCERSDAYDRRHSEYELTPFEILLDQIRARRYHLKKVSLEKTLGPEIKKDARDIILEFIRSRPPLKKSSLRVTNTRKQQPLNIHEQLMVSIRNYSTPLRKTHLDYDTMSSFNRNKHLTKQNENGSVDINGSPATKKRLLKADKRLLNHLTSSDEDDSDIDDEELKNLPILQEELNESESIYARNNATLNEILLNINSNYSSQQKRRIKPPESLKSPLAPWREPVEDWKALVTEDVFDDVNKFENMKKNSQHSTMPNRRHTMTLSDMKTISNNIKSMNIFSAFNINKANNNNNNNINGEIMRKKETKVSDSLKLVKSRLQSPVYFKSGPGYDDFGFVSTQELIKKLKSDVDCLNLTFDELCHIRNVLTKAELDYLLFDDQLFQDVSKGKVCFSCRKTKFNLFNWGCKCRICQQKICKKCLRNAQLKNGQIAQVPLFKLCPGKFEMHKEDNFLTNTEAVNNIEELYLKSYNSNSSISSSQSITNEDNNNNNKVILEEETEENFSTNEKVSTIELETRPQQVLKGNLTSEFMLLKKFQTSLKEKMKKSEQSFMNSSSSSSIEGENSKSDENHIILEICVDCYQMMDGVTVNAKNKIIFPDKKQLNSLEIMNNQQSIIKQLHTHKQDLKNKSLLKSIYLNKNTNHELLSSISPDAITMNSLSNLNIVNSVPKENDQKVESPIMNKKSFKQHHSTPTPTIDSNLNTLGELSTIIVNEEDSLFLSTKLKSSKISRQNLTLDLQPVYTSSKAS